MVSFLRIFALTVIGMALIPAAAYARTISINELPTPLQVVQTTSELKAIGCAVVTERSGSVDTPDDTTYLVTPPDAPQGQYVFCSQDLLPQLTQQDGQVAGLTSEASAAGLDCLSSLSANSNSFEPGELLTQWRNCTIGSGSVAGIASNTPSAFAQGDFVRGLINGFKSVAGLGSNLTLTVVILILQWLAAIFVGIGALLIFGGTALVGFALSPTQFATHDVVQQMWPFVLGIANVGFILALLAIAFGTVLQIQDFAARRMLPRLLFAALLINFSLLVGALIVDAARLTMAIELNVLNANQGVNSITEVGNQILRDSQIKEVFAMAISTTGLVVGQGAAIPLNDAWTSLVITLFAAVLVWGAAIGFIVIGVMLVVRYIAILLLLIASPLAFLFIAIPRAEKLANRWWTEFIKYVLYGPAVLLILIVLMRAQQVANFFGRVPQGLPDLANFFSLIVTASITIILLYMAAIAGRYLGLVGAGATVNFVSGKAKQAARLYGRGAVAPARYVGRGVKNQARDVVRTTDDAIRKSKTPLGSAYRFFRGVKRGKDGAPAKGEVQTLGQKVGKSVGTTLGATRQERQRFTTAQQLNQQITAAGGMSAAMADPALKAQIDSFANSGGFRDARAASQFGAQNLAEFAEHSDSGRALNDLASNIDKISVEADLSTTDLANISHGFSGNRAYTSTKPSTIVEIFDASGNKTGEQRTSQTASDLGKFAERVEKALDKKISPPPSST